jgi:hypothetical protein
MPEVVVVENAAEEFPVAIVDSQARFHSLLASV